MELIFKIIIFLNNAITQFANAVEPFTGATNSVFDKVLPYFGLMVLVVFPIYYCVRNVADHYRKILEDPNYDSGIGQIIFLEVLLLFEEMALFILFWKFPTWLARKTNLAFLVPWLRWIELIAIILWWSWLNSHVFGEKRGLYSAFGHIVVVLTGWILNHWVGIFLFSFPIILGYYLTLFQIALILIPTNTPEKRSKDWAEKWRRFIVLVSYTWGVQYPMFVVTHAWEKLTPRINGGFNFGKPISGIIWTKSHQVAAISSGNQFRRVDGPGAIFTRKNERPFQVIDLRNQLRSSTIDVISQDGLRYNAEVSMVFRIDPEAWDKETYQDLRRKNPLLRDADKPSNTKGSFVFSPARIRAAMSITGTQAVDVNKIIYWDQWALNVVEEATRKVLSQRTLEQLWRPEDDGKGMNALDNIEGAISAIAQPALRAAGILLNETRVTKLLFPSAEKEKQMDIPKQQIESWKADWERKRIAILDHADTEADHSQQEARAYAESVLLNSIAEGLEKSRVIYHGLPKDVVAMRFLSSLQDFISKQAQEDGKEQKPKMPEWLAKLLSEDKSEKPQ